MRCSFGHAFLCYVAWLWTVPEGASRFPCSQTSTSHDQLQKISQFSIQEPALSLHLGLHMLAPRIWLLASSSEHTWCTIFLCWPILFLAASCPIQTLIYPIARMLDRRSSILWDHQLCISNHHLGHTWWIWWASCHLETAWYSSGILQSLCRWSLTHHRGPLSSNLFYFKDT